MIEEAELIFGSRIGSTASSMSASVTLPAYTSLARFFV